MKQYYQISNREGDLLSIQRAIDTRDAINQHLDRVDQLTITDTGNDYYLIDALALLNVKLMRGQ